MNSGKYSSKRIIPFSILWLLCLWLYFGTMFHFQDPITTDNTKIQILILIFTVFSASTSLFIKLGWYDNPRYIKKESIKKDPIVEKPTESNKKSSEDFLILGLLDEYSLSILKEDNNEFIVKNTTDRYKECYLSIVKVTNKGNERVFDGLKCIPDNFNLNRYLQKRIRLKYNGINITKSCSLIIKIEYCIGYTPKGKQYFRSKVFKIVNK